MKKLIRILLNIILITILIFSGYKIYTKLAEYKKADTVYSDIREKSKNKDKTTDLTAINPDYRFWLKVDNTNIDYPVVQSEDNDYYLTQFTALTFIDPDNSPYSISSFKSFITSLRTVLDFIISP